VALVVDNEDARPGDYSELATVPRPSHADYTYRVKYGIQAQSGGGRASARETVGRVAAGAVAERFLASAHGVEIVAFVSSVGGIDAGPVDLECVSRTDVDGSPVRCPVSESAERMADLIRVTAVAGDSLGGIVTCVCRNVPAGWGEPVFHKIGAVLGLAMLSIPAVKGFEVGSGFAGTAMKGSVHNDAFCWKNGRLGTVTNHSGGIQGGITNGEPVVFRVAFKPVATIRCEQLTVDYEGKPARLKLEKGRHDSCVLPRAVPVVEAMAALVLADMALLSKRYDASRHV
jgi:chorismate synthase